MLLAPLHSTEVAVTFYHDKKSDRDAIAAVLRPRAVAVIGASRDPSALGRRVLDALLTSGFGGAIHAVNPHAATINGITCLPSARALPEGVDLAVIAVPAEAVLTAVEDCAAAGVRALVVISAGFSETGPAGHRLQDELVARVHAHGMRMVGPNCMGVLNAHLGLNASFSPIFPPAGSVALSSQSGALGLALLDLARDREIGLSAFVSVGNKADISSNDLLEYWDADPETSVILLYLESFGNPRKFARLARDIGRRKPIVAVKSGRSRAGIRAASSHTAAMAAADAVVDELFRATGVIRADTIDEMFDVASVLSSQPLPAGRRIGIVTNSGGPGILAVDACEASGLSVVEFSERTRAQLAAFLPSSASLGNPVDMVASATPEAYRQAIVVALETDETDALLVIYTPVDPARAKVTLDGICLGIATARARGCTKPIVACLMADAARPKPLHAGTDRVPAFAFPENAIRALSHAIAYREWRQSDPGAIRQFDDVRAQRARAICQAAVAARGDTWLTPEELERVVCAYRLPVVFGGRATSADDAVGLATVMGFPVAAKISAPTLIHKSDAGGVRTSLHTPEEVRKAFSELSEIIGTRGIERASVMIQSMVSGGVETMAGITSDPLFGPLVGFGLGGTDVELERDVHFRTAPLTDRDATDLVHESRAWPRLCGYRGRPPADVAALTDLLLRLSALAHDIPELKELDFNPVIVQETGHGCAIVDARIRVGSVR